MEKLEKLVSTCIPLPLENIDTDQIIPARFLKAVNKEGMGKALFYDWRYNKQGEPNPNFVLNNPTYKGTVLVAGKNFGSGSSREHAAWALAGFGFKAVVSSFFADIFKNNALNNGILPILVSPEFLASLQASIAEDPSTEVSIDVKKAEIVNQKTGEKENFPISAYKQLCFTKGFDDIDFLLSNQDKIEKYEQERPAFYKNIVL